MLFARRGGCVAWGETPLTHKVCWSLRHQLFCYIIVTPPTTIKSNERFKTRPSKRGAITVLWWLTAVERPPTNKQTPCFFVPQPRRERTTRDEASISRRRGVSNRISYPHLVESVVLFPREKRVCLFLFLSFTYNTHTI